MYEPVVKFYLTNTFLDQVKDGNSGVPESNKVILIMCFPDLELTKVLRHEWLIVLLDLRYSHSR